ncbi:SsgA family sporulation/cell division regulator [Streptomyces sp. NPDC050743]|uniref:SsgA family sporulation/cell division regulator n=1 Tax=Streptomyces sp. NPDC050743 TaxID=3365634 RepID=UPI00378DB91A
MRLQYEPSGPYAVRVAFAVVGSDETVEWIIGRGLLADGLEGPVGEGDIHVWSADEYDLCILLTPPAPSDRSAVRVRLPLVLHNTGAKPMVVQDLRLTFPDEPCLPSAILVGVLTVASANRSGRGAEVAGRVRHGRQRSAATLHRVRGSVFRIRSGAP